MASRRAVLGAGAAWLAAASSLPADGAEAGLERQLRFSITLTNPTGETLPDQVLWLYAPLPTGPAQTLLRVNCALPHALVPDPLGHAVLKLPLPPMAPWGTKVVALGFDVAMRRAPSPSALDDPRPWLKSERCIEVDDARIRDAAAALKRASASETAQAIYESVRTRLQYAGYVADDLGALQALRQGRGDCTEYAFLAVALARANGIPARMVGGYVTEGSAAPRAEEYHNWAELYLDGSWRLLDAQKEHWLAPCEQYVAFRLYRDEAVNPVGLAHRFRIDGRLRVRM
jgi:transglutaminase-like putative cysteine protease